MVAIAPPPAIAWATWYDAPSTGNNYANGTKPAVADKGVAHRTLPFGTMVKITRIDNGRSVTVPVIDRGPAAWTKNTWDLTKAAAEDLDMISAGRVRVRAQIVTPEPARSAGILAADVSAAPAAPGGEALGADYGLALAEVGYIMLAIGFAWLLYRFDPAVGGLFLVVVLAGSVIYNWPRLEATFTG